MDSTGLGSILQQIRDSEDNRSTFDESWTQGRSAFGGLSAAMAVTAMDKLSAGQLPLRSLMVSFIAPLPPGEVQVDATIQRQGRNVTQTGASLYQDGQLCLQAMAAYGISREELSVPADTVRPVSRESGLQIAEHRKRLPAFLERFEGAWVSDALPFSGSKSRQLNMWVRHREDITGFDNEKLVAIADIPPPVVLSFFDQPPVPASSLTWSLEFVENPKRIKGDWFYLEFTTEAAAEGYTQQSGRIYSEDGKLCALSRQCMVYFGNR
jgi:acyl-CoA thioesterase